MALDPKVVALLRRANFAHIATLMPDGSPNVTPVWIGVREDNVVFSSGESSLTVRNLRRDPRLALSAVDLNDPYEEVQIRRVWSSFAMTPVSRSWTRFRTSTRASRFRFAVLRGGLR